MEKKFLKIMTEIFDEEKHISLDTKFNQLKNWDLLKKINFIVSYR